MNGLHIGLLYLGYFSSFYLTNIYFNIDICEQSIFINDLRTITPNISTNEATIDIGKVMKIVGFSIQGISRSTNFTLKYSSSDSIHDLKPVYQFTKNERVSFYFLFLLSNTFENEKMFTFHFPFSGKPHLNIYLNGIFLGIYNQCWQKFIQKNLVCWRSNKFEIYTICFRPVSE